MGHLNITAILIASVAVLLTGMVWNGVLFGKQIASLRATKRHMTASPTKPEGWKLAAEFFRGLLFCFIIALIFGELNAAELIPRLKLTTFMWIGFPLMLLAGAVIWENEPWKLALIHAGDWCVKLILIAFIL